MKECTTHHHACDYREAEFAKLAAENERLKRIVEVYEKFKNEVLMYNGDTTKVESLIRQAKAEVERIRKEDGR